MNNLSRIYSDQSPQTDSIQPLKIGILDTGFITPGKTASQIIEETLLSASLVDSLGYSRYWLTEHHESIFAWACPEIVLTLVAQITNRIRVGTAGILLSLYSPIKVAEIARLIEVLYPGRFDLGIAGGIAGDRETIDALTPYRDFQKALKNNLYAEKVNKLLDLLTNNFSINHRLAWTVTPVITRVPETWLLGTSRGRNLQLAAARGVAFCYSLYHNCSKGDRYVIEEYRQRFCPSDILSQPKSNLAVTLICAETEAEAKQQHALVKNIKKADPVNVVGTPEQCQEQLLELQYRYQVSEIMLTVSWHLVEKRHYTYQMLAEVFNLPNKQLVTSTNN